MNKRFQDYKNLWNGIEDSLINTLSIIVPWFVPIIPAYLTFHHSETNLQFPAWVAWTAAFVVEVLGLASMRTAVSFYEHNRRYSKDDHKAPTKAPFGVYITYLAIVLVVNVLLDIKNGVVWWNVLAIGLFSLLSVPAGILISVRAQHTELLMEMELKRQERNESRRSGTGNETGSGNETSRRSSKRVPTLPKSTSKSSIHKGQVYGYMEEIFKAEGRVPTFAEVMDATQLPQSTVSRIRNQWISKAEENANQGENNGR